MPRTAPTAAALDEEELAAILRRHAELAPLPRGSRGAGPARLPAVRGTKPPAPMPVRAARAFWRHRALHGPVTVPLAAYAVAGGMYDHHGGQDLAVWALLMGGGELAAAYHRIHRRRAGRDLLLAQWLWEQAVIGAAGVYLAVASAVNPAGTGMDVLLGALAAGPGIAWWARGRLHGNTAPADADTTPIEQPQDEPTIPELLTAAWDKGLAATGAHLAGSAVTSVTEHPVYGGWVLRIALGADGGAARHTPAHVVAHKDLIRQVLLRVLGTLHPANFFVSPQDDGTVTVKALEDSPLRRVTMTTPRGPGNFTHPVATTSDGEIVENTGWSEDFGGDHGAVVGSTGSGKSELMSTLITLDGHTLDSDGAPLVAALICDPHGGASYKDWKDRVAIASTPEQIHAALAAVCAELDRRVTHMGRHGISLLRPSPEWPLISVYVDEVHNVIKTSDSLGRPVFPLLERIANEGRKAAARLRVGTLMFGEDVLKSTLFMDALGGDIMVLRSGAASTALKVNTGNWSVDPRKIPTRFADGSRTGGLGYAVRGDQPPLEVRYHLTDPAVAAEARFAHSPAVDPANWATDATESAATGPGASDSRAAAPATPAARGTAWEQARDLLAQAGGAMTLDQLHRGTGVGKPALANGLARAAEKGDVHALPDRGGWVLPQHATLAGLDLESVGAAA